MARGANGLTALSVLLATAMSGCGTSTGSRAEIESSYQAWAGAADDHQAAAVLAAHAQNGAYHSCMQERGYADYSWETTIPFEDTTVDDGTWQTGWLAPLGMRLSSEQALTDAHNAAMDSRMNNIEMTEQENEDGLDCLDANPSPSEKSVHALSNASGLDRLRRAWEKALAPVTAVLGTKVEYLSCLDGHDLPGHPAGSAGDPRSDYLEELESLAPDWRVLADPEAREASEEWQAYLDAESAYLDVDASCRRDKIEQNLPAVALIADKFESEHQREIDDLREHWTNVRADAEALGWSHESR